MLTGMNGHRDGGAQRGGWWSRLGKLLARYRYVVATVDQVAVSLFNLALTFCLVRVLDATEFGFVSLWMTVALLASDIQVPFVVLPLNVHVPSAPDEAAKLRLEEAVTTVNLALVAVTVVVVVAVNLFADGDWAARGWIVGAAIPVFIAVGLRREFCRSLAYCRGDMAMLLLTDGPYIAVTSIGMLAMLLWPQHLAGIAASFLALSAGGIASQLCLRAASRWRRPALGRKGWLATYRGILDEVGWALAGVVATHVQLRSYVYLTTSLIGLAGVAALNAVGVLFRPITTLLTAWSRPTLPQLAAALAEGRFAAFDRAVLSGIAAAAVGSIGWCLLLWLIWGPIETHLFGDKYPEAGMLLLPWSIVACVAALDQVSSVALQAARDFRFLAYVSLIGAPITAAATAGAILRGGYRWTMYGVAVGQVVTLAMVAYRLYQVRHRLAAGARQGTATARSADLSPGRPADGASAAQ
jgi:O-antigen/teichoic acid export membrane protein